LWLIVSNLSDSLCIPIREENDKRRAEAAQVTAAAQAVRDRYEARRLVVQAKVATLTATKVNLERANAGYCGVEGPPGFTRTGQAPWTVFSEKNKMGASSRFKSHDWQVMAETDLGRWLFSFLYAERPLQLRTVLTILRVIRLVSRRSLSTLQRRGLLAEVKDKINYVRTQLPETEWSILLHGLVHIAEQCVRWGPAWVRWMYGFERLNGYLVGLIQDRAHPERSITKVLMRLMFHRATAVSNYRVRNEDLDEEERHEENVFDLLAPSQLQRTPPTEASWRGGGDNCNC
jgi:hypothetical protein